MRRRAGAATYVVVGVGAAVAAYLTSTPEPGSAPRRPVEALLAGRPAAHPDSATARRAPAAAAAPAWRLRTDTLARGETLVALLERAGLARGHAVRLLREADGWEPRALRPGLAVTTRTAPASAIPTEITFQPAVDRVVRLRFLAGAWHAATERLAWRTDTIGVRAAVASTLLDAVHRGVGPRLPAAERAEVAGRLADVLEHRVDLSRDLQPGDSVRLLLERRVAPDGTGREARLLAAALRVDGRPVEAIRWTGRGGRRDEFYDGGGRSLRAAFLAAPLEFRRVSSAFGLRVHPILGILRAHRGTDYSARAGTPVRAIGDGVVVRAGWAGGYGNVLELRHRDGLVTRYGHLRGFARGVRPGRRVAMGQTVAYVGSTGLSTAPHLHFEVLERGRHRDPRRTLRDRAGAPMAARERGAFAAERARLLGRLDALAGGGGLAEAPAAARSGVGGRLAGPAASTH